MSDTPEQSNPEQPIPAAEASAETAAPARRRRSPKTEATTAAGATDAAGSVATDPGAEAPKRRRRKPAADDTAAVTADVPAVEAAQMPLALEPGAAPAAEAESPAPRRGRAGTRRRGPEAAADLAPPTMPADVPRVEASTVDTAAPVAPATSTLAHETVAPAARRAPVESDAAPSTQGRTDAAAADGTGASEGGAGDAAGGDAGDAGDGSDGAGGERNGRRRNRRDRRRGRGDGAEGASSEERRPVDANRPAAAAADDESDDEESGAAPAPRPEPITAGELFAQVTAGAFDASVEPTEEEASHKRVLAPEPDAPKLHKVLAQAGIGSRRDMEQMIVDGRIAVNGQPAHVGQRISFGDQVKVDGKPVRFRINPPAPRIIAYHKPAGEVVTHHDPENRPTVFRKLPRLPQGKWQSVGRLDINTEGLLLFTNSGELANQLMHPRFGVEREYAVRVLGALDEYHREELLEGVEVEGQEAKFVSIEDGGGEGANHWYRVVITEGRNREVRKLFDAVGLTVSRLIRIRYGNVVLPRGLKRGVWVDLHEQDVKAIRRLVGFDQAQPARGPNGPNGPQQGGKGPRHANDRGPNGKRHPNNRPQGNGPRGPHQNQGPRGPRDEDDDLDHGPIPNPLEQTFDRRFVQKPRPLGGFGNAFGGGGFGPGGSAPRNNNSNAGGNRKGGPKQPDPMQTSVGYIGADAFHRKGGRGGNRGGGGGGGGGFGGGFGGGRRGGR